MYEREHFWHGHEKSYGNNFVGVYLCIYIRDVVLLKFIVDDDELSIVDCCVKSDRFFSVCVRSSMGIIS